MAPPTQLFVTPVREDALVERVCGEPPPVVNSVEVIVRFQPGALHSSANWSASRI